MSCVVRANEKCQHKSEVENLLRFKITNFQTHKLAFKQVPKRIAQTRIPEPEGHTKKEKEPETDNDPLIILNYACDDVDHLADLYKQEPPLLGGGVGGAI